MKKLLCLLLCFCMLCPFMSGAVLAAEALATEVVLMDMTCEDCAVGDSVPTKADTAWLWSARVESAVSKIRIAEDAEQGKVICYSNESATSGGPRLEKHLYLGEEATNLTIDYKTKSMGGVAMALSVTFGDGKSQKPVNKANSAWTNYTVKLNFVDSTYTVYTNGVFSTTDALVSVDTSCLKVQFSCGPKDGNNVYLDDVKITTTDPVDIESVSDSSLPMRTHEEIMAPYQGYGHAPSVNLPAGAYELFTYDGSLNSNTSVATGTDALFTKHSKVTQAVLNADNDNDGKLVRMTNDRNGKQMGYLVKKLVVGTAVKKLTVEYYAVLSKSATYVELRSADDKTPYLNLSAYPISEQTAGAVVGDWNKIKAEFDIENSLCNLYVNNTAVATNVPFAKAKTNEEYEAFVYIHGSLYSADTILFDNFLMYQDAAPMVTGEKYYGTTGTNWDLIGTAVNADSFVSNLRQHPRMLVNDAQAFRNKINNDARLKAWYKKVKESADKILTSEVNGYNYGNGRNILNVARNIGSRMQTLGLVYLVEGDEKYVERGLLEIRNAATFPDWSNNAPIIPSEILLGMAFFYDWCYHSPTMTDAVKREFMQIAFDQALWQFARSYDNVISAEIAKGNSNRTTVSNSAAACIAISMADEYPEIAQYLFDNAMICGRPPILAYGADGAYPEGTTYWGYPARTLIPMLHSIQTAVEDGYTLPADAQWYFDSEELKNTNDYWLYMSGAVQNFDYGDASAAFMNYSPIIWFAQHTNDAFDSWYLDYIAEKSGDGVAYKEFGLTWMDTSFEKYNDGTKPLDKTFDANDNAQVASMRSSWTADDMLYIAMQGGNNATGHMFKSLGTFVLDANGQRFIRSLGRSDYSALYSQYMYYNERAEGQNTIIANPGEDFDQNVDAIARFVRHEEAENEAFTILDMTETNDAFTDAKRGMYMTKGRKSVVLQDEITTNMASEIWWFAHTDADVEVSADGKSAMMCLNGERMFVRITSGPADAVFTVMDARPLPTSPIAPDEEYRELDKLAIHLSGVENLLLSVEFIPLKDLEVAPTTFTAVKPMAEWSVSDNTISVNRQTKANLVLLKNSPNMIAYEQKKLIDKNNTSVMPKTINDVLYVPARFPAEALYAKVNASETKVTITRMDTERVIEKDIVVQNGVVYVPATALAEALGLALYTDESGIIILSERIPTYTDETKKAILTQLSTRVQISGQEFVGFDLDKTNYELRYDSKIPRVRVSGGVQVKTSGNTASFTINGKDYTINFTKDDFKPALKNLVYGITPTASVAMGSHYIIENMTDGKISANTTDAAATSGTTNIKDVTFEIEFGKRCFIDHIELVDEQTDAGSTLDKATWYARTPEGEWVELGVNEDLTAGSHYGNERTNILEVADNREYTAIRVRLVDTDGYRQRYYIYELMVHGQQSTISYEPYTSSVVTEASDNITVTTTPANVPKNTIVAVALYNNNKLVATKLHAYNEEATIDSVFGKVDYDQIKVTLIESFFTMKLLTEPEEI